MKNVIAFCLLASAQLPQLRVVGEVEGLEPNDSRSVSILFGVEIRMDEFYLKVNVS
jgi:hypothetical protein